MIIHPLTLVEGVEGGEGGEGSSCGGNNNIDISQPKNSDKERAPTSRIVRPVRPSILLVSRDNCSMLRDAPQRFFSPILARQGMVHACTHFTNGCQQMGK